MVKEEEEYNKNENKYGLSCFISLDFLHKEDYLLTDPTEKAEKMVKIQKEIMETRFGSGKEKEVK